MLCGVCFAIAFASCISLCGYIQVKERGGCVCYFLNACEMQAVRGVCVTSWTLALRMMQQMMQQSRKGSFSQDAAPCVFAGGKHIL
jgi:hypothetical protein